MTAPALPEILAAAALPAGVADGATITGFDPALRTRYRIGHAGAATIAAVGLAAARLWELRTGSMQRVAVDVPAATAALRGNRYMRVGDAPPDRNWDPFSGYYATRDDRSIFLHCNFPNLRDRNLAVLGAGDRAGAEAAAKEWEGEALETAIHAAGGCAGYVRTPAEWAAHPQAAALAQANLFDIIRIGDAPPQKLPDGDRPLSGVRVLDLTRVIAGPTCTRVLAEHGADVLKISRPDLPHSGQLDLDTGLGKLSAFVDLRDAQGIATLRELIATGDVFTQSYRPGSMAARGFGPADLAALRPGVIYTELDAWGFSGPWARRRGYDTVVQSVTGLAATSGSVSAPRHLPVSALDYIGGNLMAFATMVALARRATEGGSWHVRVSLARVAHWLASFGLLDASALAAVGEDVPADITAPYMAEIDAPDGRLRFLGSVVRMSETAPFVIRPAVPLGTNPPMWP